MSQQSRISVTIPDDVLDQCITKANEIRDLLEPYLHSLSDEERRKMPKMGDKTEFFVEKVIEYCTSQPQFVPDYLNVGELNVDYDLTKDLLPLLNLLRPLTNKVDDTMMLGGSDAYMAALLYYNSVNGAARQGIDVARTVYDDLKERFPGRRGTVPTP